MKKNPFVVVVEVVVEVIVSKIFLILNLDWCIFTPSPILEDAFKVVKC